VSLAEGRVFTGKSFLASSMVDSNQSLMDTVEELKNELKEKRILVQYLPSTYSLKSMVREFRLGVRLLLNPKLILKRITRSTDVQLKSDLADVVAENLFRRN